MKKNAGTTDRFIRVFLGLLLLSLTVIGPQTWFGLIGLIPLITGLIGFCPLYKLIGLNSCPVAKK